MRGTLVIHGVDLDLLEEQRKTLIHIHTESMLLYQLSPYHQRNIAGLLHLLDHWSDNQYRGENHEPNSRKDGLYTKDPKKYY